ncbi:right-handed parallel beta-helix repeat-containing protein [Corallococcus sp. M7]
MSTRLLPWLLVLLCACSRPAPRPQTTAELWVDGAAPGGDGTRERPLRSLTEALARPGPKRVHLAAGRYEGPFRLPVGMQLIGEGHSTILIAVDPGTTVVEAPGDTALESLVIEGGGWGLDARGPMRVHTVTFRNQARGAIRLGAGPLEGRGLRFEAGAASRAPPAVGVLVEAGTAEASAPSLILRDSAFVGAYDRAVRARSGATVRLEGVDFQGPRMALSQEGGVANVERARATGGTGTAFSMVEGALTLVDVRVQGHEYGVTANQVRLSVRGFTSEQATRAGMGLTATTGLLEDVTVKDAGTYGALQLTASDLEVRRFRLEGSREYGVVALQGRVRLRDGVIQGVSTADGITGDGLHLRQVEADVDTVTVEGAKGTCVLATQRARATLRNARLSGCGLAALAVDSKATLESRNVDVRDTPGSILVAIEEGQLQVEDLTAKDARGELVSTDCEGQTRVRLRHVDASTTRGLRSPCVQLDARSPQP